MGNQSYKKKAGWGFSDIIWERGFVYSVLSGQRVLIGEGESSAISQERQ
jgi:hypothetical protein